MTITRRALLAAPAILALTPAAAQAGKITLVVPFPPGGSTDALARLLQSSLQTKLNRIVVVENKSGAAGALGAAQVEEPARRLLVPGHLRFPRRDPVHPRQAAG
jgi:tripartite-type tricarboxylate transporter receptor subunit TctC